MIYFFDGTKYGFYTAFCEAYRDEHALLTHAQTQLTLGQQTLFVITDEARAKRAEEKLTRYDERCSEDLFYLLRCSQPDCAQVAFEYFKLIAERKQPAREMLARDCVFKATEYLRKIHNEIHRMHGFVRFIESESGALYAPICPDNDICDCLVPHFKARLPELAFVIHDVPRKKAAVYDGKNVFVCPLEHAEVLLAAKENEWQALWRGYYASVNIPSRTRLKQMRGYMPARYWKYMPEFKNPT